MSNLIRRLYYSFMVFLWMGRQGTDGVTSMGEDYIEVNLIRGENG